MEAINYFDMEQNAANVNILMVLHEQSIIFQKRDWILSNFLMPNYFLLLFFFGGCKDGVFALTHSPWYSLRLRREGSIPLICWAAVIFYLNLPQDNYCSFTYAIRRDKVKLSLFGHSASFPCVIPPERAPQHQILHFLFLGQGGFKWRCESQITFFLSLCRTCDQ